MTIWLCLKRASYELYWLFVFSVNDWDHSQLSNKHMQHDTSCKGFCFEPT